MVDQIHAGHQGIKKCRERCQQTVWWAGLSRQLEELISNRTTCSKVRYQHSEPLILSPFPKMPREKVGTDLFEWKNSSYLLVVDYFSCFSEIAKFRSVTSEAVIVHLKSIFARHGIPTTVLSDNGPQYSSYLFSQFAREYGFQHITSSPHFPQSNGEAERAVKTVKNLLKKSKDLYLALLAYRATPLQNGYSLSELLMNGKL